MENNMLTIGIIGIISSVSTEFITWFNGKLSDTPLKGTAAFITVSVLSIVGAITKVVFFDKVALDWENVGTASSQIFAVAQVYYALIASKLNLTASHSVVDEKIV